MLALNLLMINDLPARCQRFQEKPFCVFKNWKRGSLPHPNCPLIIAHAVNALLKLV